MEVDFENPFGERYDHLENDYKELTQVTFGMLGISTNYEVDVSLVDIETIHQINRDYRHIDRPTDVISFAFNDDTSEEGKINDDGTPRMLGEILICLEVATKQAEEIGNTLERELSFLYVHGLLHLLGYDHMKKEDEEIMFPLQEKIMEEWKNGKK